MLAWHLAARYLRRRRMAWLAMAAVTLTVSVSVVVLGVMEGWVRHTELQVRAAEADLRLSASPSTPQRLAFVDTLEAIPGVAAAAPVIDSWVGLIVTDEGDSPRREQTMLPVQMEGVDWAADRDLGRLTDDWLHQPGTLDLNAPPIAPAQRGTGFLSQDCRAAMALAPIEGLGAALPIGTLAPPRAHLPFQPGAVVGREFLWDNQGRVALGDVVKLTLPNGRGGLTGKALVRITDTLGTGLLEIDRYLVVTSLPVAQLVTDQDPSTDRPGRPSVDGYRIRTAPGVDADLARHTIREDEAFLRLMAFRPETYYLETWNERRGNAVRMVDNFRRIVRLIMIVLQGLCIFTVFAVFSTLVAEKRHDVGVLIGIGTRPATILATFLIAAVTACCLGGVLGWGIGWGILVVLNPISEALGQPLFPQSVFYAREAPISFEIGTPLLFIALQAGVGLLSALWPAWRASRIDPVDTIREAG